MRKITKGDMENLMFWSIQLSHPPPPLDTSKLNPLSQSTPSPKPTFPTTMSTPSPPPTDPPPSSPSILNWTLGFLLVGVAWGFTTPFIRRAAVSFHPPAPRLRRRHRPYILKLQLVEVEDTAGGLDGRGSVAQPGVCGAVAGESDGECVVLFVDWAGW